jgi:2-dehydropantoate 2-reductase
VYGAGAIGGHVAARLSKGGAEVSVVARGAHLAAMRKNGLTVHHMDDKFTAGVTASDDPAELGKQDAVIVTVKAPALGSVAAGIAPLLGPDTPVAFVMNGIPWWYFHGHGGEHDGQRLPQLDPDGALWDTITPRRAIGGVVYSACTVTDPGVIHVAGPHARIVLGEPDGRNGTRVEAIAAALRAGGWRIDVTERIRDAVWTKLMLNLYSGLLGIVSGAPLAKVMADPACMDAARRIVAEGQAIAAAMGCKADVDIERVLAGGRQSSHTPSIVQDLQLGRPMEIETLYAVPLALARQAGVATPTLDLLVSLASHRAAEAGLYERPPVMAGESRP